MTGGAAGEGVGVGAPAIGAGVTGFFLGTFFFFLTGLQTLR